MSYVYIDHVSVGDVSDENRARLGFGPKIKLLREVQVRLYTHGLATERVIEVLRRMREDPPDVTDPRVIELFRAYDAVTRLGGV